MMKAIVLLLLGLVLVSAIYTDEEYEDAFSSWMQKHEKMYTAEEFQNRFNIFKNNMDYVQKWNAEGSDTILGLNIMADLTNEEYRKIYLGTKIDASARLSSTLKHSQQPQSSVSSDYNSTVDWRTKGVVTPIKNQGSCGSCWSFSTTGSVEAAHALATGNLVSLSEQNLVDCSDSYGNQGCNGGLMDQAFQYIIATKGIDTEASYPYTGKDGTCQYKASNSGATISSYKDIIAGNETDLADAALKQPISVAIDASELSFQLYHDGVYYSYLCSSTNLDHGVLVVGFGLYDGILEKKNYWIVKNSWGPSWGQEGFIYMSKDRNNNCGIATSASYPIV